MLSPRRDKIPKSRTGGIRPVEPDKAEEDSPRDVTQKGIPENGALAPVCNVLVETKLARTKR